MSNQPDKPRGPSSCAACGRASSPEGLPLKLCGRCGGVSYCCRKCQMAHWSVHKPHCEPARAAPDRAKDNSKAVPLPSSARVTSPRTTASASSSTSSPTSTPTSTPTAAAAASTPPLPPGTCPVSLSAIMAALLEGFEAVHTGLDGLRFRAARMRLDAEHDGDGSGRAGHGGSGSGGSGGGRGSGGSDDSSGGRGGGVGSSAVSDPGVCFAIEAIEVAPQLQDPVRSLADWLAAPKQGWRGTCRGGQVLRTATGGGSSAATESSQAADDDVRAAYWAARSNNNCMALNQALYDVLQAARDEYGYKYMYDACMPATSPPARVRSSPPPPPPSPLLLDLSTLSTRTQGLTVRRLGLLLVPPQQFYRLPPSADNEVHHHYVILKRKQQQQQQEEQQQQQQQHQQQMPLESMTNTGTLASASPTTAVAASAADSSVAEDSTPSSPPSSPSAPSKTTPKNKGKHNVPSASKADIHTALKPTTNTMAITNTDTDADNNNDIWALDCSYAQFGALAAGGLPYAVLPQQVLLESVAARVRELDASEAAEGGMLLARDPLVAQKRRAARKRGLQVLRSAATAVGERNSCH